MIQDTLDVAKGIGDFGMMAMVAAFFLVLSATLWIACFRWFKSIINDMINRNSEMISNLLTETRTQNDMLADISDGLRPETQLRIKNTTNAYFDLAAENVCHIINKVRVENHIVDREATKSKIRTLLQNLHDDRNTKFDCFTYRGKRLSTYTSDAWVDWVADVVEKEVYSDPINESRALTNVQEVYKKIKLDFYHKMTNE